MQVRLLGTGGWLPTDRRETACVYLRDGADVLLLDAGTGARRLVTDPELLAGVERLHVVLTHFHLDHTYGLMSVPAFSALAGREVWAPGQIVAGSSAEDVVHRLLDPPFLAPREEDVTETFLTAVHELDRETEIGPFRIEFRVQPLHAGPTLAFKVNGELVYCTDTAYDEENVAFARGARVLLHEAFHAADETDDTQHSASGEAARIASGAGVERLVLVHVSPQPGAEEGLLEFAQVRFDGAELGRDNFFL